jgi:hypothetical protein
MGIAKSIYRQMNAKANPISTDMDVGNRSARPEE